MDNNMLLNLKNMSKEDIIKTFDTIIDRFRKYKLYYEEAQLKILNIPFIEDIEVKSELLCKYLYSYNSIDYELLVTTLRFCTLEQKNYLIKKLGIFDNFKLENFDVLNIPANLKFGLEIEYSGVDYKKLMKLFDNEFIYEILSYVGIDKKLSKSLKYNFNINNIRYDKWNFTKECGNDLLPEASSPILLNRYEDLYQIYIINTIFNLLQAKVCNNTGIHINVGLDYFNGREEAITYLLKIWQECEVLFFKIASPEYDVIRDDAYSMASPIKQNIEKIFEASDKLNMSDFDRFIYNLQVRNKIKDLLEIYPAEFKNYTLDTEDNKYLYFKKYLKYVDEEFPDIDKEIRFKAINFSHISLSDLEHSRIEFRIFNSTLSFKDILSDILLIGKLCEVSLKLAKDKNYKIDEYTSLLSSDVSEEEKLDNLLNLLFDETEEKEIYKDRWESIKDNPRYDKYDVGKPTFRKNKQLILKR